MFSVAKAILQSPINVRLAVHPPQSVIQSVTKTPQPIRMNHSTFTKITTIFITASTTIFTSYITTFITILNLLILRLLSFSACLFYKMLYQMRMDGAIISASFSKASSIVKYKKKIQSPVNQSDCISKPCSVSYEIN